MLSDADVPVLCAQFVRLYGRQVRDAGLRTELARHMLHLCTSGLLSFPAALRCINALPADAAPPAT